jgi:hypothetical protein
LILVPGTPLAIRCPSVRVKPKPSNGIAGNLDLSSALGFDTEIRVMKGGRVTVFWSHKVSWTRDRNLRLVDERRWKRRDGEKGKRNGRASIHSRPTVTWSLRAKMPVCHWKPFLMVGESGGWLPRYPKTPTPQLGPHKLST